MGGCILIILFRYQCKISQVKTLLVATNQCNNQKVSLQKPPSLEVWNKYLCDFFKTKRNVCSDTTRDLFIRPTQLLKLFISSNDVRTAPCGARVNTLVLKNNKDIKFQRKSGTNIHFLK